VPEYGVITLLGAIVGYLFVVPIFKKAPEAEFTIQLANTLADADEAERLYSFAIWLREHSEVIGSDDGIA
jgi:hypothetical protein